MNQQMAFNLPLTALGPNDPDDGEIGRQQRGMAIAAITKIEQTRVGYKVPSMSGKGSYVVSVDGEPFCTCPDFATRQRVCKHIYAVQYTIQRETNEDGSTTVTETVQVTQTSQWTIYNEAQTHEQERFAELLRSICDTIPQPPQNFGRPRLPLSDVVFGLGVKVYSTMSGRRIMTELREAQSKGLVDKAPSFTSNFRYLEKPELTPLLKSLIERSAMPLQTVETDFAADSSGFSTSVYDRWFDHKWGKMRSKNKWVKCHLMCGVKTHVVTSIEVTATETADAPQLPGLLERTAENFNVAEVSADKAYSSIRNLHSIESAGATPYIPFKQNATGRGHGHKADGLWDYMLAYFNFNRGEFLTHYHKRSNVETAFSMIKGKFGGAVRAKTPVAQVNEVLCKVLCHNICVLIQSIYELGIEAVFPLNGDCSKSQHSVPKVL